MAVDATPNYRVNIEGHPKDFERDMVFGGPRGGGGGIPLFPKKTSPTYPTGSTYPSGSTPSTSANQNKGFQMTTGQSQIASQGIQTAGNLYGAKKGSDAATKSADMQTRAATRAAEIQAQSSADQLKYIKRQSELDRLSKRFSDKQNYGLSSAGMMNDFNRYGDTSFNTRASELSQGRTQDKVYGGRQNQMNYMRAMLGMPQNELSVYVEPDALQLTRPTLPDYVDDTTPIE